MASAVDIPLLLISDNAKSERRISPAWTIAQLKTKLEPLTGIPASSQRISIRVAGGGVRSLDGFSDSEQLGSITNDGLQSATEIHVADNRPAALRENYSDVSAVQKYEMPQDEYESRTDSVLAWKKAQKLGRFDPNAPGIEEQKRSLIEREIKERGIAVDLRCRLLPETDARRGRVASVGDVPEIPGHTGAWIGIALDEPTGKNDGSVGGTRYFTCEANHGAFVRPERVEVGDFPVLNEFGSDEEF